MIKSETITARIKNRILVTDAPIFSGEAVRIKLDFDCGEAVAANHKIVLFGVDKTALAEGIFTASESAWIADLNTATREMAAYFADVPVDATKTIGAMVIDTIKSDVITRGNVLVVSTPFPDNLAPCPQTYAYLTVEEFSSSMAEVETEISGKADASDFVQLSNTVADLSSAMASKADSSTVADLAEDMRSLVQSISDLDINKADADIVDDLAAEVAALPYIKTIIPETAGRTITFAAETRHVYGVAPYGNNEQISVSFPQPTNQIFDCIIDADCRDAESQILIVLSDTYFSFKPVGGGLTDLATLDPGEMYRIYLTQTAFVTGGKPVIIVNRKQL